ncbi:MAG: polysaccharide deacetylase family protein [Candidatus Rokuibacteriota bacterium]|nr:MAG: polysaccharide deacetylase family protein [Candidatus Rokubacteria bacterium]
MLNVLTVDVEDYFSVETFRHIIRYEDWDRYAIRVDIGLRRILDLLERHNVTATFFVLGWMADRRPDVVRDIHRRGHEIACHGYRHQMIHAQSRGEFREDIHRAKAALEDLISEPVVGYRAPTFSITQRTLWALSILAEEGYRYDSSIYPIVHDRYGIPAHTRVPHWIDLPAGRRILELPLATGVVAGRRIPFGGGGYLRIYPLWLTMWLLRRLNGGEGRPAVIYVHPWELDPEQPRQPVALLGRFRNYYNLERTHDRLEVLLRGFRFGSVRELVRQTAISERISLLEGVDPAPGDREIAARPPVV